MTLAFVLSRGIAAQMPNAPPERLINAKSLRCNFDVVATGTWKNGVSEAAVKPTKLSVAFHAIDTQDGTAEAVGDAGKTHITVRLLGSYLHFMQMDPYGALHVTTVFAQAPKGDRFQAAHTRHEYTKVSLPGLTSRPEQYYGDCEVAGK